jgi:hypothetical protein
VLPGVFCFVEMRRLIRVIVLSMLLDSFECKLRID